jgi:hypothetical protein
LLEEVDRMHHLHSSQGLINRRSIIDDRALYSMGSCTSLLTCQVNLVVLASCNGRTMGVSTPTLHICKLGQWISLPFVVYTSVVVAPISTRNEQRISLVLSSVGTEFSVTTAVSDADAPICVVALEAISTLSNWVVSTL